MTTTAQLKLQLPSSASARFESLELVLRSARTKWTLEGGSALSVDLEAVLNNEKHDIYLTSPGFKRVELNGYSIELISGDNGVVELAIEKTVSED